MKSTVFCRKKEKIKLGDCYDLDTKTESDL